MRILWNFDMKLELDPQDGDPWIILNQPLRSVIQRDHCDSSVDRGVETDKAEDSKESGSSKIDWI